MSTFTTSIQLNGADENEYREFQDMLHDVAQQKKQHFEVYKLDMGKETKARWGGDVTLVNISGTILKAAERLGKKYPFHIIRNK